MSPTICNTNQGVDVQMRRSKGGHRPVGHRQRKDGPGSAGSQPPTHFAFWSQQYIEGAAEWRNKS